MISLKQTFTKRSKLPWRIIDDEAVIVDMQGNSVLQLNDVGRYIWEIIDESMCVENIINSITKTYDVNLDTARNDCLNFISVLVEKKLIHELQSEV